MEENIVLKTSQDIVAPQLITDLCHHWCQNCHGLIS